MADNVAVTQGSGTTFSTDEIGGVHVPRIKIQTGTDGSATDVSSSNPLPISDNGGSLTVDGTVGVSGSVAVTGTFFQATQPVSGTVTANLGTIAGVATEVTSAAILAKIIAAPATEAKQDTQITSLQLLDDVVNTDGAASGTKGLMIGGHQSGSGTNFNPVHVSSGGALKVDLNGALAALESDADAIRIAVETIDNAISGSEMQVDVVSSALPTGASTLAEQQSQTTLLGTIDADTSALAACASGSELQVDIVSSALPSGASTLAEQQSQTTLLGTIDTDTGSMASSLTSIAAEDFATETTLAALNTKVPANLTVTSTRLLVDGSGVTQPVSGTVTAAPTYLDVVDFLDTNPVLDTSGTNIPASASNPLELVATLAADVKFIKVNDTTGEFIGVYTGAALSEVLQCIIGPGQDDQTPVLMTSGQRVSVRNMANSAISVGSLCIQFIG